MTCGILPIVMLICSFQFGDGTICTQRYLIIRGSNLFVIDLRRGKLFESLQYSLLRLGAVPRIMLCVSTT